MVLKRIALALLLAAAVTPAAAGPAEDYIMLRTAELIDDGCHVLKYNERKMLGQIAYEQLRQTTEFGLVTSGRMGDADYNAWLADLNAKAAGGAGAAGCGDQAGPPLLAARGAASALVLRRLLHAFHFDAMAAAGDSYALSLSATEKDSANRYIAFIQQLYGDNFPAFLEQQKAAASQQLPPQVDAFGLPSIVGDPATWAQLSTLQTEAWMTLDDVDFEVTAEMHGHRVRTQVVEDWMLPSLVSQAAGAPPMPVWAGPEMIQVEGGSFVKGLFVELPDGKLRLMTYGDAARETLAAASATLYVRSEDPPAGVGGWEIFQLDDWRSLAFPFDGVRLEEACLGAPCWEFSAEAREAILQGDEDEYFEIRLAPDPDVPAKASVSAAARARISGFYLFKLAGRDSVDIPG